MRYRERLLTEGELSRRTIQKILVQLYSILKRAKRKGWIDANPAEDAERVTVRRTGDFTVLPPTSPVDHRTTWAAPCLRDCILAKCQPTARLRALRLKGR